MSNVIKQFIATYDEVERIGKQLIDLFNSEVHDLCEHYKEAPEKDEELFMNHACDHPKGDGHCCIADCPMMSPSKNGFRLDEMILPVTEV